jgi:hypothetical protein
MAVAESPFKMLATSLRRVEPPLPVDLTEPEPEPEPELPSVQFALFGRSVQPAAKRSQLEKDSSYTIQTTTGPVVVTCVLAASLFLAPSLIFA